MNFRHVLFQDGCIILTIRHCLFTWIVTVSCVKQHQSPSGLIIQEDGPYSKGITTILAVTQQYNLGGEKKPFSFSRVTDTVMHCLTLFFRVKFVLMAGHICYHANLTPSGVHQGSYKFWTWVCQLQLLESYSCYDPCELAGDGNGLRLHDLNLFLFLAKRKMGQSWPFNLQKHSGKKSNEKSQ